MHAPNNKASKYMRQKLIELQEEVDESIIIVEDFNMSLSEMDCCDGCVVILADWLCVFKVP